MKIRLVRKALNHCVWYSDENDNVAGVAYTSKRDTKAKRYLHLHKDIFKNYL